jgi:membrane protein implicated in regulation of membrane protease activity
VLDLSAVAGDGGGGLLLLPILIPTLGTVIVAGVGALVAWLTARRTNRREDVDSSVERIDRVAGRQEAEIARLAAERDRKEVEATRVTVDRDFWRTRALKAEAERDEQRDLNDHLVAECARKHRQ